MHIIHQTKETAVSCNGQITVRWQNRISPAAEYYDPVCHHSDHAVQFVAGEPQPTLLDAAETQHLTEAL